jgi:hypothetical protein
MDQIEVNLSLSAVVEVEAIDSLQIKEHTGHRSPLTFAGGLTLSTASNNAMALADGDSGAGKASRPRRFFLMTICINTELIPELEVEPLEGTAHHMLVAVQENPRTQEYELFFYDSAQRIFRESYEVLALRVENALRNLGWTTHRLEGNTMEMGTWSEKDVVQQKKGWGWACGVHTVINGWILAMGLTPAQIETYDRMVYWEFRTLARASIVGLLDWRTLVAWFFCRRLTVQDTLDSVPSNRRFETTKFWESEDQLFNHMSEVYQSDNALLEIFTNIPYDYGYNPIHPSQYEERLEKPQELEQQKLEEEEKKKKKKEKEERDREEKEKAQKEKEDAATVLKEPSNLGQKQKQPTIDEEELHEADGQFPSEVQYLPDDNFSLEDFPSDGEDDFDYGDDPDGDDATESTGIDASLYRSFENPEPQCRKRIAHSQPSIHKVQTPDALIFSDGYDGPPNRRRTQTCEFERASDKSEFERGRLLLLEGY